MSLRARILLLVLLATLVPAVVVGAYLFGYRNEQVEEAKRNLSALAQYAAENLDGRVQASVQMLHGLSRAPDIDTADRAACSDFLAGVLARYPQYTGILTLTPAGNLHCDSLRTGRELNVSGRDYFKQVSASLEPAFDTVIGGLTGIAVLQVAYPVLDREGRLKYVLLASLNLSQYAQNFAASSHNLGIRTLIWNRNGVLMVHKPEEAALRPGSAGFAQSALFRFAAAGRTGDAAELPGLTGERRVWALGVMPEPRAGGARITLGVPRDELAAEANKVLRNALAVLIGVSLLGFAAALYVAETGIRRQVRRIAGVAGRVGFGEVGARIGAPYPRGDLGELMEVVDGMAGAVEAQQAQIESRSRDLERSNRALRTLSAGNEALVRATDEAGLLKEMTRILNEVGGYPIALVGYAVADEAKSIELKACAGIDASEIGSVAHSWGDNTRGQSPLGRALRLAERQIVRDIGADPGFAPWREALQRRKIRAVLGLPLRLGAGERPFGALSIAATETEAFDTEEQKLLEELAGDLTYGIANLRAGVAQRAAGEKLRRSLESTIEAVAATMETRDPYTAGHQRRVATLAAAIAVEMGLPADVVEGIHFGALIHDLGKIQVPAEMLAKPTRLTKIEFEIIKTHAQAGYEIIKGIEFPWPVAQMVLQHHERIDGSGYPQGLKGEQMIPEARILAVADVVEAMSSHRPYRPGLGIEAALKEIEAKRGTWFEPAAVDACLRLFREKRFKFEKS